MKGKFKYLVVIMVMTCGIFSAPQVNAEAGITQRLVQWFRERQKLSNLPVGTVEEISENKVLISVERYQPRPKDELIIYSYQPTLDPSVYPEVAIVKVETLKWNQVQARIIIEKGFSMKKGDVARYPPVGTILLDSPDEIRDTPEYNDILHALVSSGFTVVETGNISDFPYGYVVNLNISGKIETVRIISIFDEHLFYMDSAEIVYKDNLMRGDE